MVNYSEISLKNIIEIDKSVNNKRFTSIQYQSWQFRFFTLFPFKYNFSHWS